MSLISDVWGINWAWVRALCLIVLKGALESLSQKFSCQDSQNFTPRVLGQVPQKPRESHRDHVWCRGGGGESCRAGEKLNFDWGLGELAPQS